MILNFKEFLIKESEELSKGQQNALKAGKDILSKSQFCLLYCVAKDEGDSKEMLEIMKIQPKYKEFSGINFHTFSRSLLKMQVCLGLKEPPHSSDEPHPLMVKYVNEFEDMTKSEIIELACECFDEEHEKGWNSKVEDVRVKNSNRQTNAKIALKSAENKIYQMIADYMKAFKNDLNKAIKAVSSKVPNYTEKQLKDIWIKK